MARRRSEHASVTYEGAGGAGPNISRAIVIMTCVVAIVALIRGFGEPTATAGSVTPPPTVTSISDDPPDAPSDASSPTAELSQGEPSQSATATPSVPRVGVVAGHWGSDDGAACPDGLTEVKVNLNVAELVAQSLRGLGYEVDLLEEFDTRLDGYLADALVSIHADSCERIENADPPPTGFKVASVEGSYVPEEERRLVECLTDAYAERTGLPFHENSITGHMTGYHTFFAIDGRTPGAIIETGFMWLDRELLTQHPDVVAQGIVDGIVCYLEGE